MKFDTVGVLRVLLGESQYLPDSRYRRYINTAITNIMPEMDLSRRKKQIRTKLFGYRKPTEYNPNVYMGNKRTKEACVMIYVCARYLLDKTNHDYITLYRYGQIKVISGMALRMISENKRRIYEN